MSVAQLLRDGYRCDRTGDLWREFLDFHHANPWIFDRLKELVARLVLRGHKHYSMRTLIHVLRFEWDLMSSGEDVVIDSGETIHVKLNNNHSPYYARMLVEESPHLWEFFEMRRCDGDPEPPAPAPSPPAWIGQGSLF